LELELEEFEQYYLTKEARSQKQEVRSQKSEVGSQLSVGFHVRIQYSDY